MTWCLLPRWRKENKMEDPWAIDYEIKDGDLVWCLHCERVYRKGNHRIVTQKWPGKYGGVVELKMCPYEGCSGDAVADAWPYARFRAWRPDFYPAEPKYNVVYPQYPPERAAA